MQSTMKYFTLSDVVEVCCSLQYSLVGCQNRRLFSDFACATVPPRLSSTLADTNCLRADCVSSWTMVLIGMGESYGVGTRVFVQ